jgi:predicted TIM-barrel fold metal-dependent hydrolase
MDSNATATFSPEGFARNPSALGFAAQPLTEVDFDVPKGACDCLTHIFGDPAEFSMSPTRTYTPQQALVPEIEALHKVLHVDRVIIVHPTIYGTNNDCTLDALQKLGPARALGIAVVDPSISSAELDRLHQGGMRGVRINLETVGLTDPEIARQRFKIAVQQVAERSGWHIQIYTRPSIIEAIYDLLDNCPVPLAFDHFGGTKGEAGMQEKGYKLLLDLIRFGKAYVKLSGPYLVSTQGPSFPDLVALARSFIRANPERVLWGTNWPHPHAVHGKGPAAMEVTPLRQVDDGRIFNLLPLWAPDPLVRKAILADNPARLYGF